MNTTVIRTSVVFPMTTHQGLQMDARRKGKTVSELLRELAESYLAHQHDKKLDQIYAAMEKTKGICKDDVTDASSTIDQTLYGPESVSKDA